MEIIYQKIESKEQLIELIRKLSNENTDSWENMSINDYLEAMGAWIDSAEGFYKNSKSNTNPDKPSWQLFADALQAAKIYE